MTNGGTRARARTAIVDTAAAAQRAAAMQSSAQGEVFGTVNMG